MLSRIIEESLINELKKLIFASNNIVITCHVSPDGDAIGSSLALWHILSTLGKNVKVITPDQTPKSLSFLPGISDIDVYSCNPDKVEKLIKKTDLIICLDFNTISRIDKLGDIVIEARAKKVMIDHHLYPDTFSDVLISYPEISSTCALLFYVVYQMELYDAMDVNAAQCLYTGMMTDTGNFSYNSCDPDLYVIISKLLEKGINKDEIYTYVYNTNTESSLRINGYAISKKMELDFQNAFAILSLNKEELDEYNYKKGDTEGLVNIPLSIPGISCSVFFREDNDFIKVSMRSKGEFYVNTICEQYFNGGGHKNAAGGEFYGSLNEAVKIFRSIFEK